MSKLHTQPNAPRNGTSLVVVVPLVVASVLFFVAITSLFLTSLFLHLPPPSSTTILHHHLPGLHLVSLGQHQRSLGVDHRRVGRRAASDRLHQGQPRLVVVGGSGGPQFEKSSVHRGLVGAHWDGGHDGKNPGGGSGTIDFENSFGHAGAGVAGSVGEDHFGLHHAVAIEGKLQFGAQSRLFRSFGQIGVQTNPGHAGGGGPHGSGGAAAVGEQRGQRERWR